MGAVWNDRRTSSKILLDVATGKPSGLQDRRDQSPATMTPRERLDRVMPKKAPARRVSDKKK